MYTTLLTNEPRSCSTEDLLAMKECFWKREYYSGEFARGSLIFWNRPYGYKWLRVDDAVLILYENENRLEFFAPYFGEDAVRTVRYLLELGRRENRKIIIGSLMQDEGFELLKHFPGQFQMSYDRDMSDYIYHVESLAKLPGSRYHKKKNLVNRFNKLYDWSYRPMTKDDRESCLALEKAWMAEHDDQTEDMCYEIDAISMAFDYFDELSLFGGMLFVDGAPAGFTIGERMSELMSVTHFEKAEPSYDGIYQMLNQQFAENELMPRGITYVNREEDMGLKGLRKAKESYAPDVLFDKYCLTQK